MSLVIAERAGLALTPGVALPPGQRAHVGKVAIEAGFVPLRIGREPACYVRRPAAP